MARAAAGQPADADGAARDLQRGAPLRSAAEALDQQLVDLEDTLIQRKLTGRGQDGTRWPAQLVSKLTYLAGGLASHDFPATESEQAVHALLKQKVAQPEIERQQGLHRRAARGSRR